MTTECQTCHGTNVLMGFYEDGSDACPCPDCMCKKCGNKLDDDKFCTDETCPYHDWTQIVNLKDLQNKRMEDVEAKYPRCYRSRNDKLRNAAGDLLEALQNLMGLYNTPLERMKRQDDAFYKEAIDTARRAIEKAT